MEKSVCFIGHRKIEDTPELRERLRCTLSELIKSGTINFIFGDNSEFNSLCYDTVTELKEKYPEIRRIHFRKDYENTDDYLIIRFEESICPEGVGGAGRASYVKRNQAMIDESEVCIFHYDENYLPPRRKYSKYDVCDYQPRSGTAIAYNYATQKKKQIINI